MKIGALGLRMALSSKAKDGLVVVDSLELKDAKTKALKGSFEKAGWNGKVLVIDGDAVDEDQATPGGAGRVVVLECHRFSPARLR